jgi:hypothetical protein
MSSSTKNQAACNRIRSMHTLVDYWLRESVSTPQSLEFFILSKAVEISSGNKEQDYYDAMMIRNDQLLAVVEVFTQALAHIQVCSTLSPEQILISPDFIYFADKEVDTRIFETAVLFYDARRALGN